MCTSAKPSKNIRDDREDAPPPLQVLALEPFYGGSHKAFLDHWIGRSCHHFTLLELPAHKWKWRMRHAAVTFANQLRYTPLAGHTFDVLWCSDMLNLAEFLGLAPEPIRNLPRVVYFHENQLTYPVRVEQERDLHFAYSNFTTCLAADQVWFNSAYHQLVFTSALIDYLDRMPDHGASELVETITAKSIVQYPGITEGPTLAERDPGPLRIAWNARWEHDKNPEDFFAAMRILKAAGLDFQLLVLGESFGSVPPIFPAAREEFAEQIYHWGYAADADEYRRLLTQADIVASTAQHEFFGIAVVEAMAAGCLPLLPDRLAYPEVLAKCSLPIDSNRLLYGQTPQELAATIQRWAPNEIAGDLRNEIATSTAAFLWNRRAGDLDQQLATVYPRPNSDLLR